MFQSTSRRFAMLATFALAALSVPAAAQDAFPITIDHALGKTIISAEPQRIVTIGWMSQDAVLALGVMPVGIPDTSGWGGGEDGFYPWTREAIDALGGEEPQAIGFDDGIPFEEILALDPDLILARYSGLTADEYERLSVIAPTVAYAGQPWSGEWRDITRTVGKALGRSEAAEQLVAQTDALITAQREAHPEFEGTTFTFAGSLADGASQVAIYVSTDPRVQLIEDLGLQLSDGVKALPTDQGFNIPVSLENLESVEADLFLAWHPDEAGAEYVRTNPVFSRFRPVAEGHVISFVDRSFVMATSAPSPLSVPWSIDRLVPQIAEVLSR